MGKAARWFRSFLGKKDQQTKDPRRHQDQPPPPPPPNAKRWSFGKSSRDSAEAAASATVVSAGAGNAAIARAAEAAWLRSAAGYAETDREREQSKHAIAVAAATAAAADAAVAAAQAAVAVVRLTSKGRAAAAPVLATVGGRSTAAAVRIQTAFRGFLAKKALRALKALVKLQALVRGYLVRRQAAATLHSMQALVRAQATVRAHRAGVPVLPHLHHLPPLVRPRYSLQERYADDTRSEHGGAAAYGSRRMSASLESSSYGYDRSPKIVEVDPGRPTTTKSRSSSSRRASSPLLDAAGGSSGGEDWCANSSCSPLPCYLSTTGPPRIAVPTSRQFPDHDWCCAPEKPRPATAQSTPRYMLHAAPATPTKSVAGGYSPSLNGGCPNYMSSTQASEAKVRSQSAPKQRPELAACGRKRVPLSEVVVVESSRASLSGVVGMQRGCSPRAAHEAFSFKTAVVGRIDRTLEVAGIENDRLAFLQRRW
ncbi:hypothetical protein HU200_020665 [Digitaria exilis]|uniref:DUF4005 domain-containing protein n=1 Tax=Digitaria exilis TaxID=1010633 RepID=A0A835F131_9POAL|nr:hypothetical protein HU200_020665 [Digitaria exilis]CAB3464164.1 unnamed protein product [Digitaria exilis]